MYKNEHVLLNTLLHTVTYWDVLTLKALLCHNTSIYFNSSAYGTLDRLPTAATDSFPAFTLLAA
jgi:hypothetical protein